VAPTPDIGYTGASLFAPRQGTIPLIARDRRQHKHFVAFLVLSVLLHLLLALFAQYWSGSGPPL